MSARNRIGKRADPSSTSAAPHHGVTANSSPSGSSAVLLAPKSGALIVLAFIAALVPTYFVGYWVDGSELSRMLAGGAIDGHTPKLNEALQMVDDLPSTFADVSRKLEIASGRASVNPLPEDRSVEWREPSPAEILQLANNAQSQFAEVNSILGVRSGQENPQSQFASVNRLMEILSADMSKLSSVEKEQMIKDANTQTAIVFKRSLPMAAVLGMTLFAIDPAGTTLRYSYRLNPSQNGSDASQARKQLRRQVCGQTLTRTVMRHGGHYEFFIYDSNEQLINQHIVSDSSCRLRAIIEIFDWTKRKFSRSPP